MTFEIAISSIFYMSYLRLQKKIMIVCHILSLINLGFIVFGSIYKYNSDEIGLGMFVTA